VELQEVVPMASVVLLGTLGTKGAEHETLPGRARRLADDTVCLHGRATGVAGLFGTSNMERLPTEVAITENMKHSKRIARAAAAT
jgi:predicted TIM-barrel enzyme